MLTRVAFIKKATLNIFCLKNPAYRKLEKRKLYIQIKFGSTEKSIFYISQEQFFLEKYDIDVNSSEI
jgi:hypothetical protein